MEHFPVIYCLPDERSSDLKHGQALLKRAALKLHHYQNVCAGITASLAAGLGAKQDHFLRSEMLHKPLGEAF
jgi:hypothetical protein